MNFKTGLVHALPIFVGYLSVAFTFGIAATTYGHPAWSPILMSLTHISGTGQFILIDLLRAGSSTAAIVAGVIAINLRYVPMALAVAQRLPASITLPQRLFIALGDTDEIVGVALRQTEPLTFPYMAGLFICSWAGWIAGTLLGANPATQAILPGKLVAALGIALPAMFVAIVLPEMRKSRRTQLAAGISIALSLVLRALPRGIDPGWATLICGFAGAIVAALAVPMRGSPATGNAAKEGAK